MNAEPPSPSCSARLLGVCVFLAVSLALLVAARDLFRVPTYEEGDSAANALAIERAKHGAELLGNYSRFGFNHPGPAFFYVYAAGEWVLLDWLRVVPVRNNAHLLALALIQSAFFAATIAIVARRGTRPWRAAGFLTAGGLVHLAFVPSAFLSHWPPFVLVLPFACFLCAAASVARAGWHDLFWLVLSGGFLLHGHVAQPMFVVPLGFGALCFGLRRAPLSRASWLLAGSLAALFTLPVALDALRGRDSNFHRIFLHLHFGGGPRPNWGDAIASTFSYFGYCTQQEHWWGPGPHGGAEEFFRRFGVGLMVWPALLVGALLAHRKIAPASPASSAASAYARTLALLAGSALLLAVIWARRQDDGITDFNSYFVFGLILALGLAAGLVWLEHCPPAVGRWVWPVTFAALALTAYSFHVDARRLGPRGAEIEAHLDDLLRHDPQPRALKALQFPPDQWVDAVTLAAALQRRGIDFRVAPTQRVMFGARQVFQCPAELPVRNGLAWWHLVATTDADPSDLLVSSETQLRLGAPPLPALPATLSFASDGNAGPFRAFGISDPDTAFSWTEAPVAAVRFISPPAAADLALTIEASAWAIASRPSQRVQVFLNRHRLGELTVGDDVATHHLTVPAAAWNDRDRSGAVELLFALPDAVTPSHFSPSRERRQLGLRLRRLTFAPAVDAPSKP